MQKRFFTLKKQEIFKYLSILIRTSLTKSTFVVTIPTFTYRPVVRADADAAVLAGVATLARVTTRVGYT